MKELTGLSAPFPEQQGLKLTMTPTQIKTNQLSAPFPEQQGLKLKLKKLKAKIKNSFSTISRTTRIET